MPDVAAPPLAVLRAAALAAAIAAAAAAAAAAACPEPAPAAAAAAAATAAAGPPAAAELYVPPMVEAGAWHYGMVRHEGPRGGGGTATARLAADAAAVLVDASVELPPGADHAIFAFRAIERGEHTIRASVGGEFAEAAVAVAAPGAGGQGLAVTLPPSTRTPHVTGAVHLVEWRGGGGAAGPASATAAAADLEVRLSAGRAGGILVPDSVVIPAGSTGATFDAFVAAPGSVHARAVGGAAMSAEARIGFERGEPAPVRVRAWPPVLPENSVGHYIAWLGDAGAGRGRSYGAGGSAPPAALVHTSDSRIAAVGGHPAAHGGAPPGGPARVQADGWPLLGTFRTGSAGAASLTVAVPGHGSATDWFVVGPSAYGEAGIVGDNGTVLGGALGGPLLAGARAAAEASGGRAGGGGDGGGPNLVVFDVIPPAADAGGRGTGGSFIAAAAYRAQSDRTVEVVGGAGRAGPGEGEGVGGAGRVESSGAVSMLFPAASGPAEIVIASNGAGHAATAVIGGHGHGGPGVAPAPSNSAVVPVRAPPGSYEVSVTAPGMRQHPRAAPLEVHGDGGAVGAPRLYILPLPVAPGRVQDIALLYAGDAEGRVLDPAQALGGRGRGAPAGPPAAMLEAGGGASVSQGFAAMDSPVVRVRGSPGPGGAGTLSAWAPGGGIAPATAAIGGWGEAAEEGGAGDAGRGPAVHAPRAVRAHEVFPAVHALHAGRAGDAPEIDASGACRRASGPEAAAALAASGGGGGAAAAGPAPAGGLFVCAGDGRLSVFSGAGHGSIEVRPYARDEAPEIRPGFGGTVRAGGEYRIGVEMPPAPPGAPGGTVAVDTAVPHEVAGGGVVLRPGRAGTFPVAVAASAPGYASASAILDVAVDASVAYSVEARGPSGEHLAVPVSLSAAGEAGPRAAETPHRETGERRAVTVEFPREARHGDRSYELVAARVRGADAGIDADEGAGGGGAGGAGGGAGGAGPAPSAVTAEPRDGDVFSASYARTVLVAVAGGAAGGGSFREGQPVSVSAPDMHVLSFLVREVWDGWDVRPAGGAGGAGPGRGAAAAALAGELDAQGRTASFAAADDVVVAARYREDHTGAAAIFAAGGMLAVLAVFRGAASYRLRAAQALDSAEAALAAVRAAARRWLPFLGGGGGGRAGRSGDGAGAEWDGAEAEAGGADGGAGREWDAPGRAAPPPGRAEEDAGAGIPAAGPGPGALDGGSGSGGGNAWAGAGGVRPAASAAAPDIPRDAEGGDDGGSGGDEGGAVGLVDGGGAGHAGYGGPPPQGSARPPPASAASAAAGAAAEAGGGPEGPPRAPPAEPRGVPAPRGRRRGGAGRPPRAPPGGPPRAPVPRPPARDDADAAAAEAAAEAALDAIRAAADAPGPAGGAGGRAEPPAAGPRPRPRPRRRARGPGDPA